MSRFLRRSISVLHTHLSSSVQVAAGQPEGVSRTLCQEVQLRFLDKVIT